MSAGFWFQSNWPSLLGAIGVVGGLLFNGIALRSETKARRVTNLVQLTQNHREIWAELYSNPKLLRVIDPAADIVKQPPTEDEETFVNSVILHLNSSYYALEDHLVTKPEGLCRDVRDFFSLPVPRAIWERRREEQNIRFVQFVEKCRG